MMDIVLVGSGGCMREIAWQIQESNKKVEKWTITGYVDNMAPQNGNFITVGNEKIHYLGNDDMLLSMEKEVQVIVAIGSSKLRKKIVEKLSINSKIKFPNLVLSTTDVCVDAIMGQGCIVSMGAKISTNVKMGNFVFLNTDSMLCHDGTVGDYVTLSPRATVAGAVKIGCNTEIGMGANIIQGVEIGKNVIVGAGAVAVHDVEDACTVVGVPARKIRG